MQSGIKLNHIYQGNTLEVLKTFPSESIDCVVTSPPYYALRDYNIEGQLGLEATFQEYLDKLWQIFDEIKRVLKPKGTIWVNLGDTYFGGGGGNYGNGISSKQGGSHPTNFFKGNEFQSKCLMMIPCHFVIGMIERGWILRNEIIWHKPNPLTESVKDCFTKAHEYIYFFTKQTKYYFGHEEALELATGYDGRKDTLHKGSKKYKNSGQGINEKGGERWRFKNLNEKGRQKPHTMHLKRLVGEEYLSPVRNKRDVWTIPTKGFPEAHFAVFPEKLIETPIKTGCPEKGIVLDTFMGSGTTAVVARKLNRKYVGIELNPEYIKIAERRLEQLVLEF